MRRAGRADDVSTALTTLAVSLRIAREATDDVPIVKQILGSAVHVVELVMTIRNGNAALVTAGKRVEETGFVLSLKTRGENPKQTGPGRRQYG
ncbi:hypothetical protein EXIGLDRAFT_773380 [Exidia glandulosa HHB12029]|uniref:Uncharacterized protein n=1 Tax=Exidia glandulosa HHB12029 TaxID=1314781 RepID=A0A165EUW4_EXIGL|nr:hypothetical protein EXIGLDRAFT_773380 [Exidia glandulosa HHB12029]